MNDTEVRTTQRWYAPGSPELTDCTCSGKLDGDGYRITWTHSADALNAAKRIERKEGLDW
jgi:hypothetical protein